METAIERLKRRDKAAGVISVAVRVPAEDRNRVLKYAKSLRKKNKALTE